MPLKKIKGASRKEMYESGRLMKRWGLSNIYQFSNETRELVIIYLRSRQLIKEKGRILWEK